MADTLSEFTSRLHGATEESGKFGDSIHKSGLSITKLFTTIAGSHHVMDIWRTAVKRSDFLTGVNSVFAVATKTTSELIKQQNDLRTAVTRLNAFIAGGITMRGKTVAQAQDELRIKQAQLHLAERQVALDHELRRIHLIEGAWYATILVAVGSMWERHKEINRELIDANSSFETRYKLTQTILDTQIQLGSEYRDTLEATRALVHYGYDVSGNLGDQVKLVMQMRDGLGVAVGHSAELVAVYDRQLRVSVRDVADGIARISNDTGLAADEATRLAVSIGRSISMLRPGLAKDVAAVNELIGRYEGSLQELGGQFGAFSELLTRMTTPEGMMQAGILGVNSPEFLASKEATKRVVDSFAQYAKQTLGDSRDWDRALRLQTLAEQFGTTTQNINLMIMAADRANNQQKTTLTLQQRYEEQISSSGGALSRLSNSLHALFQLAVTPLLRVITPVINGIASLVGGLIKIPGAVYAVSGAMLLTLILVAKRLYQVGSAFVLAAVASHRLTVALREQATASLIAAGLPTTRGRTPGAGFLADLFSKGGLKRGRTRLITNLRPLTNFFTTAIPQTLRTIGQMLVRSISIGSIISAGALTALAVTLWKTTKALIDNYKDKTTFNGVLLVESMAQRLQRSMTQKAMVGDIAGVRKYSDLLRDYKILSGQDKASADAYVARRLEELPREVGKLRFAQEIANDTFSTDVDRKNMEMQLEVQKALVATSERQREIALKNVDANKEANRIAREKAEEEKRNRRIMRPPMMPIPTGY